MKPTSNRTSVLAGIAALSFCLALLVIAQMAEPPQRAGSQPPLNWYSAQKLEAGAKVPPLPGNPFPELPVYQLDEWSWVYDDRGVDYEKLRGEAAKLWTPVTQTVDRAAALAALGECASELLITRGYHTVVLTITNATAGMIFDLFQTFELIGDSITNSVWDWVGSGTNGQSLTVSTCAGDRAFYVLRCGDDADHDGLSDAFELLVGQTSPASTNILVAQGSILTMLTITNATSGKDYDIFRTFEPVGAAMDNAFWFWVARGTNGQSFAFSNGPCAQVTYALACTNDTDGDGLTDAFEVLVNKTSRLCQNTLGGPFTDFEGVNVLVNDPEQDCGHEQNTQDETTLTVLSNTVVAAWVDSNRGRTGYGSPSEPEYFDTTCNCYSNCATLTNMVEFIGWSVSKDGGRTFADRGAVPLFSNVWAFVTPKDASSGFFAYTNLGNAGDPVLACDLESRVVYLAGNPQRPGIYYPDGTNQPGKLWVPVWRSTNNGESFLAPSNAAPDLPAVGSTDFADGPTLVVDNYPGLGQGYVYLAFAWSGGPGNPVVIARTINGTDWMVATNLGSAAGFHQLCVTPTHEICIVWRQSTVTCTNRRALFFSKSSVGGTNFSAPLQITCLNTGAFTLTRSASSPTDDAFRAPPVPRFAVNPVSGDLYYVYHDKPETGSERPNIYFIQSTNGGTDWSAPVQVNDEPGGTPTDQWQPVLAVKPDGTQLFIAWYDRRTDPTNHSLIQVYGTFACLPITGVGGFGTNFPISTVAFPPAFTGTNQVEGTYDPVYPPNFDAADPRVCTAFQGLYKDHMGDYDTAVADSNFVYHTWADNRLRSSDTSGRRNQADIRRIRLPWPK